MINYIPQSLRQYLPAAFAVFASLLVTSLCWTILGKIGPAENTIYWLAISNYKAALISFAGWLGLLACGAVLFGFLRRIFPDSDNQGA